MAARVPPALNLAVLCSYVEFDGTGRPFSLVEPLHTVALPPDPHGRLTDLDAMLYVQLDDENAFGTFWFTAEVRTASGIVIPGGRTRPAEVTFSGNPDPLRPYEHVFHLRWVVFPGPGWYHLHVMCNHLSLHGQESAPPPVRLRVIPAEPPLGG
jgi:hypothetical protein